MIRKANEDKPTLLQSIVGEQLSSIEFVQDYVQFRFDGPCLTAFTDPVVTVGQASYRCDDTGYCEALRRCIGRKVVNADVRPRNEITIDIEGAAAITISLKPEDYSTVEAASFQSRTSQWMIWRIDD